LPGKHRTARSCRRAEQRRKAPRNTSAGIVATTTRKREKSREPAASRRHRDRPAHPAPAARTRSAWRERAAPCIARRARMARLPRPVRAHTPHRHKFQTIRSTKLGMMNAFGAHQESDRALIRPRLLVQRPQRQPQHARARLLVRVLIGFGRGVDWRTDLLSRAETVDQGLDRE
jgi:hypothetical protein